ncbi:MAG: hypothetical protein A2Z21_07605 [Candidatus Fraserbacteria bacterium RBG_16_55_9]|uniref:DUF302 domain-containing protein n=1 Tax=Fraserbacteria sp. (strain RBG_16_55_9) TaxID=1817864 RepID=A0A1F5V2W3_FRAXR|nr:MAG: hypothetical protein A2Z21_07605 [Candidatus Fraserbacteria bacterium RBG_16_55_9]
MGSTDFVYIAETTKSFQEAVIAVRRAAESAKWGILGDYDFSEILAAKGFPQSEQVKSLDICAPAHANRFMSAERLTALCMPCSVLIFTDKGKTKIAAMRPGAVLPQIFLEAASKIGEQAKQIDEEVESIIDQAARG